MEHLNDFERTLENKLVELISVRGLYLTDRILHEASGSTNEVFVSARIAGTSIEIWIYNDEAQFGGGGIDCRFERYDYDTPEGLMAAFLVRLEEFLPEPEDIDPIKLPIVINDSSQVDDPGDLQLYERLSDAELDIEAIDVENEEFFGFDAEGRQLRFDIVAGSVRILAAEATLNHKETLRKLLATALRSHAEIDEAWCKNANLQQLVERAADAFPSSVTTSRKKDATKREPAILDRILGFLRK